MCLWENILFKWDLCSFFFLSRGGSVYNSVSIHLLETHTYTSSCPVKPPPPLSPADPEIIHQRVRLRKLIHKQQNIQAPTIWEIDPSQRLTFTRRLLEGLFGGDVTFSKYKHRAHQTGFFLSLYRHRISQLDSCLDWLLWLTFL